MKRMPQFFLFAILLTAAETLFAGTNGAVVSSRVYVHAEYFEWKESLQGSQFVKESGPVFGIGGQAELSMGKNLLFVPAGEFFTGQADYNGEIEQIDGTFVPAKSTTVYYGLDGSLKIAAPIAIAENVTLKPAAGLGFRAWERVLDSSYDSRYIGQYGYIEDWFTAHGILGVSIEDAISPVTKIYASADVRLPIWTLQNIDMSNVGGPSSIELNPKARATISAEAGMIRKKFLVAAFWETLDFGQSDYDSTYGAFLQPASRAEIIGIKTGISF
jgi:hypothetical protein